MLHHFTLNAELWFHVDATQGGLRTLYVLASTTGAGVLLQKIVTLRRGDAAARPVIARSLKPDAEPKHVHDCVEASA